MCRCSPTLLRLVRVIGENFFACSFFLDGRSPPTRVPVEQASVSTALPITESMEYFTRDRSLRKRDGRINTTAQRQKR